MDWRSMGLECALKIIINHAVQEEKRERFLGFAKTKKGLHRWVESLDHFERYLSIETSMNLGKEDMALFIERNASESMGFAISTQKEYQEGVFASAETMLNDLMGSGNGSLLLIDGLRPFCLYLGEDINSKYVWRVQNTKI